MHKQSEVNNHSIQGHDESTSIEELEEERASVNYQDQMNNIAQEQIDSEQQEYLTSIETEQINTQNQQDTFLINQEQSTISNMECSLKQKEQTQKGEQSNNDRQEKLCSQNVFVVNKDLMKCSKQDHDNNRIKFLCIDSSCNVESKLACAECLLFDHFQHKYTILDKFTSEVSEKFTQISKKTRELEEENKLETYEKKMREEVHTEFEDIKQLVMKTFDECVQEYIQNIQKLLESSQIKMEYNDKFQQIQSISTGQFDEYDSSSINKIIEFHQENIIEKSIEENQNLLSQAKGAISKKQVKYFDKFRHIIKDILKNSQQTPIKESQQSTPIQSETNIKTPITSASKIANAQSSAEKKKRKLQISEEHNTIFETPVMNQTKTISEYQNFTPRSFAGESRRFINSGSKKLKTELINQQQNITQ